MKRSAVILTLIGLTLTGCGGSDAKPADPSTTRSATDEVSATSPGYVESDACREDARPLLDILALALKDKDVRDVASRMAAVEEMGQAPTAQCSAAVAAPTREAISGINCALDWAIGSGTGGQRPKCADDAGAAMGSAVDALQTAQEALDAEEGK